MLMPFNYKYSEEYVNTEIPVIVVVSGPLSSSEAKTSS